MRQAAWEPDAPRLSATAVLGVPLFNKAAYLPKALDSLLGQCYRDFALILVDDGSSDETPAIAADYAERDPRVTLLRNPTRLGMVANWRRCFDVGRETFPHARYFAWASDHDVWHPDWLQELVAALDRNERAVLAYPFHEVIDEDDRVLKSEPRPFDTVGIANARRRMALAIHEMAAGSMVYGLFRADHLARAGVFRPLLAPDRLLLLELSIRGEFVQVPRILWQRRFRGLFSLERQRSSLFPGPAPWYARRSPHLAHVSAIWWLYVARGAGQPELTRLQAVPIAAQASVSTPHYRIRRNLGRRKARLAKRVKRARKRLRQARLIRERRPHQ